MSKLQLFHLLLETVKCYHHKKKNCSVQENTDLNDVNWMHFFQLPDIWTQYECMLPSHQAEMLETILRLIEWSGFFIASTKWLYKLRDSSMAIDKNHHDICDFYTLED